jgi:hypothetical protein
MALDKRSTRYGLVIIGVLLVAVVFWLASRGLHSPSQQLEQLPTTHRVILDNATEQLHGVAVSDIENVEKTIYDKLLTTIPGKAGSYAGTIRPGSMNASVVPYGDGSDTIPYHSFIVDIPGVSRTFQVTLAGGRQYPVDIPHALCPSVTDLKYGYFKCEDPYQ